MDKNLAGFQRYFIELAFLGTAYHGWQIQENALSVQECVNKSLSTFFRQNIETVGCGRTDTGVHAKQLFAHFDLEVPQQINEEKSVKALNALLPRDIVCISLFPVENEVHARFDALSRTYEYHIHFEKNPFLNGLSWQKRDVPDLEKMNKAAEIMMEYEDFSCFSKAHTQVFTNNCTIEQAEWKFLSNENKMVFTIKANRFLRNMVRAIVGTLLEIGDGKHAVEYIRQVIDSKNRSIAGTSVPAGGLYLIHIEYPENTFQKKNEWLHKR